MFSAFLDSDTDQDCDLRQGSKTLCAFEVFEPFKYFSDISFSHIHCLDNILLEESKIEAQNIKTFEVCRLIT